MPSIPAAKTMTATSGLDSAELASTSAMVSPALCVQCSVRPVLCASSRVLEPRRRGPLRGRKWTRTPVEPQIIRPISLIISKLLCPSRGVKDTSMSAWRPGREALHARVELQAEDIECHRQQVIGADCEDEVHQLLT